MALITGVPPEVIRAQSGRRHYSDAFMVGFLQARGFRTLRLTPNLLVKAGTTVGPDHVLLISQLFRPREGTWGVIFGELYYHNFEVYALSGRAFLNKPILSGYLVIHPKWRIACVTKKPKLRAPSKGRQLTLAAIRKGCDFAQLRKWA